MTNKIIISNICPKIGINTSSASANAVSGKRIKVVSIAAFIFFN